MSNRKQIGIGALLSYISIAINILAGLLYTPWMVQQIGKSDYGLYTLANSLISLFLVDFGLSTATSRYVAKYIAEKNQDKVNNFLGAIYKLYLLIDALILIALTVIYFCIDNIYLNLTPQEIHKFKTVYIIAASFAVVNFPFVTLKGIINAYEKFIQLKIADLIYRFLVVGITVSALVLGYGLYALVSINAIVGLIIIVYKLIVIKKCTPINVNIKYSDKTLYKEIFGFSLWTTISVLATRLIFNITPSILGVTSNTSAIAVFGIISTIEGYVYLITSAINGMFMPKISRIYANTDASKNITSLLLRVAKFQYALNGLIIVGFTTIGRDFILEWMGNEYIDAYIGILLVIIPGIIYNSLQIANTALVVEKKVHLQAYVTLISGVSNVILSVIFSKIWGVIGSCISIFIAYMIRNILVIYIYKKHMHLDINIVIKKCFIKMGIPIVITIVTGILINLRWNSNGLLTIISKSLIITIIYFIIMFFFGLTEDEQKSLLKQKS